jgi:uncharacterized sporulation protein YeaH/YhbH (DUF444 family)
MNTLQRSEKDKSEGDRQDFLEKIRKNAKNSPLDKVTAH